MTSLKNGVVRVRVVPRYTRTALQDRVRSAMGILALGWRTLTAANQKTWNDAVSDPLAVVHDPITGTNRPPTSGRNLFLMRNLNLAMGFDPTAPPTVALASFTTVIPDELEVTAPIFLAGPPATFNLTVAGSFANSALFVRITPPLSKGITKAGVAKGKLVPLGTEYTVSPLVLQGDITTALGAPVAAGERRYVEVWQYNSDGTKTLKVGTFVNT